MIGVNLIPPSVQQAQARRRRIKTWSAVAALALAALASSAVYDAFHRTETERLRAEADALQTRLEKVRTEVRLVTAESNQAALQLVRADALRRKRAWSGLLALAASCLPDSCRWQSVVTDPPKPLGETAARAAVAKTAATTGAPNALTIEAPRKLRLIGYAADPAQPVAYVTALKQSGVFKQVQLERSSRETVGESSAFRFELLCEW